MLRKVTELISEAIGLVVLLFVVVVVIRMFHYYGAHNGDKNIGRSLFDAADWTARTLFGWIPAIWHFLKTAVGH